MCMKDGARQGLGEQGGQGGGIEEEIGHKTKTEREDSKFVFVTRFLPRNWYS